MRKILLLVVLLTTACQPTVVAFGWECPIESNERIANFIIDCSRAANPMSDEEGEDLVSQCDYTAKSIYCVRIKEVRQGDKIVSRTKVISN